MTEREVLKALVTKLEAIANDPSFKTQAVISQVHGFAYTGPNWSRELADAKAVLSSEVAHEQASD